MKTHASSTRLHKFMAQHSISHREMAKRLRTPYGTFKHWVHDDGRIPGSVLLLLDILERSSEARKVIGI